MFIDDKSSTNKFTLYPPAITMIEVESEEWMDDDNDIQPIFTISQVSEEDQILNSIENNESSLNYEVRQKFQEQCNIAYFSSSQMYLYSMKEFGSSTVEISPGKSLNINKNLEIPQQENLIKTLQQHSYA